MIQSDEQQTLKSALTDYVALTCTNIWRLIILEAQVFSSHLNLDKYSVVPVCLSPGETRGC